MKKMTMKQKREFLLKFAKENLEQRKIVYNKYLEALVEYNMENLPYSAIWAEELLQKELEESLKLKGTSGFFRTGSLETEKERIENNILYYDKLIKKCQGIFKNTNHSIKLRIARDAVEKGYMYLKLSLENSIFRENKKKSIKEKKK